MDDSGGFDDHFINNIAVAIPAHVSSCSYSSPPYAQWNFALMGSPSQTPLDTFSNNITQIIGAGCQSEVNMYGRG